MNKILIKTPEQIAGIRKAGKLTTDTLDMIEKYIHAGVSTEELDVIMNTFILSNGGKSACIGYLGNNKWGNGKGAKEYKKCTCISINDVVCHGTPNTSDILKDGDILNIDVTTIVDNYFGDASRMYTVGSISQKAKDLIAITKQSLDIGLAQVRPNNFFGNIGFEIAQFAEKRGYSIVRDYTGHGVGVMFHEAPYVFHKAPKNSGPKMQEGMVFTIEPMINTGKFATKIDNDHWTVRTKDGSLSAQWEHTILVTKTGYEILAH